MIALDPYVILHNTCQIRLGFVSVVRLGFSVEGC